jgi:basic membrane protein A and related proteins
MLKSAATILFTLLLASTLFAAAEEQKLPVVMVTDVAGLGNHGPNDVAWSGASRASREFSLPISAVPSLKKADYAANLATAAGKGKIVITAGTAFVDAVKSAAPRFAAVRFVHVGGDIEGVANVMSFEFRNEDAGFLAGVAAAAYTKTGVVGIAMGPDSPAMEAYAAGFLSGIKAVGAVTHKRVQAVMVSAGTAGKEADEKALVQSILTTSKADVVFPTTPGAADGALDAVKARPSVKIIWADADRSAAAPEQTLVSVVERGDNAVFQGIQAAVDNVWQSGHVVLGYREGGIALSEIPVSQKLFAASDLAMIERAKDLLGTAAITIPVKRADVVDWQAPSLTPMPVAAVESSTEAGGVSTGTAK